MLHDTTIIAHCTEGGEEQSLHDHVEGVALLRGVERSVHNDTPAQYPLNR